MAQNRLFIFAIGGTGARVMKALTMLLASGVKANVGEIVPIFVDPHQANEDLKRTKKAMQDYQSIRKSIVPSAEYKGFFQTKILALENLTNNDEDAVGLNFDFNLRNIQNETFGQFIGYDQMDEPDRALVELLFSGETQNAKGDPISLLNASMEIGFIGHPNLGSIVLNQFATSKQFEDFANLFQPADRVFIISSIFGGTGAAGFPLILKNIRSGSVTASNKGYLKKAKIGAVTVMPYFNIQTGMGGEGPIKKSDFIVKTKAALSYYHDNISGNKSINALYYIGDDGSSKPYPNDPGYKGQRNDAHFVELASAMSILDFLNIPDEALETSDQGKVKHTHYRAFGIKKDENKINFQHLGEGSALILAKPLTQYALFCRYLSEHFPTARSKRAYATNLPAFDSSFASSFFHTNWLTDFNRCFTDWLREMSDNQRGFAPFNMEVDLQHMIQDVVAKKSWWLSKVDYDLFDDILGKIEKGKTYGSSQAKLIQLGYQATDQLLTDRFTFFENHKA